MKCAASGCENDTEYLIRCPAASSRTLSADSPEKRLRNDRGPGLQASPAPRRCCCTARATPCLTPQSRPKARGARTPGAPGAVGVPQPGSLRACKTPAELPRSVCCSRERCGWPAAAAAARRRPATARQRPWPRLHSGPARPRRRAPVPPPRSAAARGGARCLHPEGRPSRRCWTSAKCRSGGGGCGCKGRSPPGARHCRGRCDGGCDWGADAAPAQGPPET